MTQRRIQRRSEFLRFTSENPELNRLQQNAYDALSPLLTNPRTQGVSMTSVSLSSGENRIAHGLGFEPQGWAIERQRGSAHVFDLQDANNDRRTYLALYASAPVVIDLYLY